MANVPIKLSQVKPDFESLLLQFQYALNQKETWKDLQTSGTGETLLEMFASLGTFLQFGIESAAREGFLTHAARSSSIYAITRMLGVRIGRKYPAGVDVVLERETSVSSDIIPKFTTFSINGKGFFNRQPLMFSAGSTKAAERVYYGPMYEILSMRSFRLTDQAIHNAGIKNGDIYEVSVVSGAGIGENKNAQYLGGIEKRFELLDDETDFTSLNSTTRINLLGNSVRLYEGTITSETFNSDASVFQEIYLKEKEFSVSDVDVEVTVRNPDTGIQSIWTQTVDGIWIAESEDEVYYDATSGDGETILTFGDGLHGKIPPMGSEIIVRYAVTSGATGNNGLSGLQVVVPDYQDLKGTTVSVISGGADEKGASFYRYLAPQIFKARNRAVTLSDYRAVSLDYPGVVSASVQAQRDIAPGDLRWMNVVQVCLLPLDENSDALTQAEWDDYLNYMENHKHAAVQIATKDPIKQTVTLDVTVALKSQYTPSDVIPIVESNLNTLFSRQVDTLGRRITMSDIMRSAMITGVDYVDINVCMIDSSTQTIGDLIPTSPDHFLKLNTLTVNTKYSERLLY